MFLKLLIPGVKVKKLSLEYKIEKIKNELSMIPYVYEMGLPQRLGHLEKAKFLIEELIAEAPEGVEAIGWKE